MNIKKQHGLIYPKEHAYFYLDEQKEKEELGEK